MDSYKNPMEGKYVIFVEDDTKLVNADGVRGYLKAVDWDTLEKKTRENQAENETAAATEMRFQRQPSKLRGMRTNIYRNIIKRGIGLLVSFLGLILLSPVYLGIVVAIKIDDPGPAFFTQKRIGKNKKYFKLHKFRSMKMSTPHDVPTHMLENPEQYITRVGRFLRAHSLDELPQIWDIFVGNMAIIGPRPALWNQDVLTAERDRYRANDVRPGLTGWAQINGRDELTLSEKARLDGEYVQKQSFAFDLRCFFGTAAKVVKDDSIVEGHTENSRKA